jgi:hypothetical protein
VKKVSAGGRESLWERLDRPTKVIGTIVAAAASLVGIAAIVVAIIGNPFSEDRFAAEADRDPAAITVHQVQRCMDRHGLRAPEVHIDSLTRKIKRPVFRTRSRLVFKRCDWPPITSTSTDGYTEVRDDVRWIPGKVAADMFAETDTLRASCDKLDLTFALLHMSGRQFRTSRVEAGRVLGVAVGVRKGAPALAIRPLKEVPDYAAIPLPSAGVFHVLRGGHINLFDARCSPLPHH